MSNRLSAPSHFPNKHAFPGFEDHIKRWPVASLWLTCSSSIMLSTAPMARRRDQFGWPQTCLGFPKHGNVKAGKASQGAEEPSMCSQGASARWWNNTSKSVGWSVCTPAKFHHATICNPPKLNHLNESTRYSWNWIKPKFDSCQLPPRLVGYDQLGWMVTHKFRAYSKSWNQLHESRRTYQWLLHPSQQLLAGPAGAKTTLQTTTKIWGTGPTTSRSFVPLMRLKDSWCKSTHSWQKTGIVFFAFGICWMMNPLLTLG